jgi:hypothetical protein
MWVSDGPLRQEKNSKIRPDVNDARHKVVHSDVDRAAAPLKQRIPNVLPKMATLDFNQCSRTIIGDVCPDQAVEEPEKPIMLCSWYK